MGNKIPRGVVVQDVIRNRNHSWFEEVRNRAIENGAIDNVVIKYLGTDITYKKFINESYSWARALKANGIKKGEELVVCMDKTPEFVYLLGAASIIGAKINVISDKFAPEFIEEIIKNSDSKHVFIQNVKLAKLKGIMQKLSDKTFVPIDWDRSLNPEYKCLDTFKQYYLSGYDPKEEKEIKASIPNVGNLAEFLNAGETLDGEVEEAVELEDPFTITYSSGTTKKGRPKAIMHSVFHYILMGRYHDKEVSGLPEMKGLATYSNIPCYSNSWILSCFSDILIKGGVVILDPVDAPEYFFEGINSHKSDFNIATTSTWLLCALKYYGKERNLNFRNALFNFAAGEPLSPGEEKFLNKFLMKAKALPVAKMCTAGADCEHGSLFINIFRAFKNNNKILRNFLRSANLNPLKYADGSDPAGMEAYDFAEVKVLRRDGSYAGCMEYGEIVCNSPITMMGYRYDDDANDNFWITTKDGLKWARMKVYGYIDNKGRVHMKGRIPDEETNIPEFMISDTISQDTKNIMSCETVSFKGQNSEIAYLAYVMPQFGKTSKDRHDTILKGIGERCIRRLGPEIGYEVVKKLKVVFLDPASSSFQLTSSGKRDIESLRQKARYENLYHKPVEYITHPKGRARTKRNR